MQSIRGVLAPAKLNLFLHITGQRPDGYHLLQSVFVLIDWYDTLDFALNPDARIERIDQMQRAGEVSALPEEDLCVRAALALQRATGCSLGARITLSKSIPQEAGMGGGSSDAASTLLALNKLWGLRLKRTQLLEIAQSLGADVPFFLFGSSAWVEGTGERLQPVHLMPTRCVVLKPSQGVSTQEIFRDPKLNRASKTVTIFDFADQPLSFGHNDLQVVAERLCPEISKAILWLKSLGLDARMTGSGSAVFAHLPPGQAFDQPPPPGSGWQLRVCSILDAHPHSEWAFSDK